MSCSNVNNQNDIMTSFGNTVKDECIIALKVYDFCRQQDCLTSDVLGPARAECFTHLGNKTVQEGDIIDPPSNAATVSMENLRVKKVIVADKEPNPFKNGYWDITLKYVFVYTLVFREADGTVIGRVCANSIYTKKVTLFGSIGTEISISTDLFGHSGSNCSELNSDPFVLVESKSIALNAELKYRKCCGNDNLEPVEVAITIGLFTIIKLFRLVNLSVLSRGFCIPKECEDISPLNPCEFFDNLDFPMDIFAPPQKTEFLAGISGNIPKDSDCNNPCNDDCNSPCNEVKSDTCGNGCSCDCPQNYSGFSNCFR